MPDAQAGYGLCHRHYRCLDRHRAGVRAGVGPPRVHGFCPCPLRASRRPVASRGIPAAEPLRLDVTDAGQIAAAAELVANVVGEAGLAGLVNNAGIAVPGPLELLPIDAWRRQLEVNVIGQVAVTQAFLPLLRKGRGRLVNIGSVNGGLAIPYMAPYSASKFALEAITDALRTELRPFGIQVAAVEPGPIHTPIWEKSLALADRMSQDIDPAALGFTSPTWRPCAGRWPGRPAAPRRSSGWSGRWSMPFGPAAQNPLLPRPAHADALQNP